MRAGEDGCVVFLKVLTGRAHDYDDRRLHCEHAHERAQAHHAYAHARAFLSDAAKPQSPSAGPPLLIAV